MLLATAAQAVERPVSMPVLSARPYGWTDDLGKPQGLYPDIAAALARETGLDIRVEIVPFARAASLVAAGTADSTLMFSTAFTEGKAVEAVIVFYAEQVVQMRSGLQVKGRKDLSLLSLGRLNGGCQELAGDDSAVWRFQDILSQESGVRMLAAGRIDGFCTVTEALVDAMAATGLESSLANAQRVVLGAKPVWLLLSTRLPKDTAERMTQGMRRLQKNGEIQRIFKARLGSTYVLTLPK